MPKRILHFDMECRPLSWISSDYVSKEITAISWGWHDQKEPKVELLTFTKDMTFLEFMSAYDDADIVTGHYIRGFDLPLLNTEIMRRGHGALEPRLSVDTKIDLKKQHGRSNSQENLAAALGVGVPKIHMTEQDWRDANRLSPAGLAKTRTRVMQDVRQHRALYDRLIQLDMLGAPKLWTPESKGGTRYHA